MNPIGRCKIKRCDFERPQASAQFSKLPGQKPLMKVPNGDALLVAKVGGVDPRAHQVMESGGVGSLLPKLVVGWSWSWSWSGVGVGDNFGDIARRFLELSLQCCWSWNGAVGWS